jgi:DNA-binding Xre family transcriptional regulator
MMILKIREIATQRGITIEGLMRATGIPRSTIRRLFYSSATGLERDCGTLKGVNFVHLIVISAALGVSPFELVAN